MGIGWFTFLIVGLLAGWIAEKIMHRDHGLLTNLIVGVVGAYLGAFLVGFVVDDPATGFISALIVSVIGACALLAALAMLRGKPVR